MASEFLQKRVALLTPHLGGGGAHKSTLSLARGLVAYGYTVDILVSYDEGRSLFEVPARCRLLALQYDDAPRVRHFIRAFRYFDSGMRILPLLRRQQFTEALAIAKYIETERPHFLMPTLTSTILATLLALPLTEVRPIVIPIVRNHPLGRKKLYRKLLRFLLPYAHRVVAISDGLVDSLSQGLSLPPNRIVRIYNPVVSDTLHILARERPPHCWFDPGGPPVLLAVGRLAPAKDYPTLLRAFRILTRNRPLRLVVLGEGDQRQRLEALVSDLGLRSKVCFLGWVANPYAYMSNASAFVLSSKFEGLGNVLIEALACGCPVVATDCPSGPREILNGGEYGALVPVGDHVALAAAINKVLTYPFDQELLRKRGCEFTFERSVEQYSLLLQCLSHSENEEGNGGREAGHDN